MSNIDVIWNNENALLFRELADLLKLGQDRIKQLIQEAYQKSIIAYALYFPKLSSNVFIK